MRPGEDHKAVSFMTQRDFRILLDAMSRPGRIQKLEPAPLYREHDMILSREFGDAGAFLKLLLVTLIDNEVSFCVTGDKGTAKEIAKFTGSHISVVRDADFVIVPQGGKSSAILDAKRGTLKYPDEGATIIFCVERLREEIEAIPRLELRGPGIADTRRLSIAGIDFETFTLLKEINSEFPLGVDSFFVDKAGRLAAIPRSTAIEVKRWDT